MNLFFLGALPMALTMVIFAISKKKTKLNLLPSPPRLPLIGNLHQLGSMPHRSMQAFSRKYGDLMLLHLGCYPTIILSSAEMAREVLKTHGASFLGRPPSSIIKRIMYKSQGVAFSPHGECWRNMKRICVDHLLSTRRVQSYHSFRKEEVTLLVERIRGSSSGLVNLTEMFSSFTISMISRMAFGRKYEDQSNRFQDMIGELVSLLRSFPRRDFIPLLGWVDALSGLDARVRNNINQIDSFLEIVLDEHIHAKRYETEDQEQCMDFVDVLLSLKDDTIKRDNIKALVLVSV